METADCKDAFGEPFRDNGSRTATRPRQLMNRRYFLRNAGLLLLANRLVSGTSTASDQPDRLRIAAGKGREFLAGLIDPALNLLPEYRGASVCWLFHDNYLAAKVLQQSHPDLANRIHRAIQSFSVAKSGKMEILFGEAERPLPFRHPELVEVRRVGSKIVKTEIATDRELTGWAEYADLLLLAAIALVGTQATEASQRFEQALAMWDGMGLKDRVAVKTERCAVYKLALALVAAHRLNKRPAEGGAITERLLAQQSENGGWVTDYTAAGEPVGLANVETTSLAVLALETP